MSTASPTPPPRVRFGQFELDLRSEELRRDGVRVAIPGQSFQVLALLVKQAGELVTRDELCRSVWPDGQYVDFEHGLNAVVKRLRDALGDSADAPRFVETLTRRGYRFIAPVDRNGQGGRSASVTRAAGWHAQSLVLLVGGLAALYAIRAFRSRAPDRDQE